MSPVRSPLWQEILVFADVCEDAGQDTTLLRALAHAGALLRLESRGRPVGAYQQGAGSGSVPGEHGNGHGHGDTMFVDGSGGDGDGCGLWGEDDGDGRGHGFLADGDGGGESCVRPVRTRRVPHP